MEFVAQCYQLIHAHKHPNILHANTAETLRLCVDEGLIDVGDADILVPSIRLYHDLTQIVRVCFAERFDPTTATKAFTSALVRASFEPYMPQLEERLKDNQAAVRACFEKLVGPVASG